MHPREQALVSRLEVESARDKAPKFQAAAGDIAMANAFCDGSLARHLSLLETEGAARARALGLSDARMVFGPAQRSADLSIAPATITLTGPQETIGAVFEEADVWAPSVFFDGVRLAPRGALIVAEARGRVVCRAP